jgi:hypothetical protein
MAETLIGIWQTAAFSLSATSPQTFKYTRYKDLCEGTLIATTALKTAAFAE